MKFTFACKKISLNDSIKEYAEKKIRKLDRYFPEEADAFVIFSVEKKNRCVVELTIRAANGTLFRAQESTVPAEFDVVEDNDFDIIRTKRFSVKPMTTDEAVLQMNLLDHTFYVFRNVDDGEICVVYRRTHGGYGLIETEE